MFFPSRLVGLVRKVTGLALYAATTLGTLAQPSTSSQPATQEVAASPEIISVSAFEVTSTQGKGYVTTNSASGFKTNEPLINIPQAILVVTRDLIDDIGYKDMSDVLQFAGVVTSFRGERAMLRGSGASVLIDDMIFTQPYLDNAVVDSYQILRGPTSVLYIGTGISGVVIKSTKKPLQTAQRQVTTTVDEHGSVRGDVDFTGPLGKVGDARFSYRLIGVAQGGDSYFKNVKDDRYVVNPSFQLDYHDTTVRVAYEYYRLKHIPNANNPITPDGKLYEGAGKAEAWFPENAMETFAGSSVRGSVLQRISPTWEARVQAQSYKFYREGAVMIPGGLDWGNKIYYVGTRYNDQVQDFFTITGDVIGKYKIAKFKNQSAFGAAYSDERNLSRIGGRVTTAPFGTIRATGAPGFPGVIGVPLDQPSLAAIRLPSLSGYTPAANPGSRSRTYRENLYYQHTLEIIPDRLSLVGGITYSKLETNNITNLSVVPPTATVTYGKDNLHRYGVVFHVVPGVSLYALESTTFSPPAGRDQNFNLFPNVAGKGQEAGIKTALWDGRVSTTFSVFKQELTNQAAFGGNLPNGVSFQLPIGSTTQKGIDGDIALAPLPGLELVLTGYLGHVTDQTGAQVNGTYKRSVSIFSRYEFPKGPLGGLAVGGGFVTVGGRTVATGGATGIFNIPGGVPPFIRVDGGHLVNLFASYKFRKEWMFRLNVANVLDDYYAVGLQGPIAADPSTPRTFSASATYRF